MLRSVVIGPYATANNLFVAPMAGVTDRPFRALCRRFGAGHAVSEMTAANPKLWGTDKTMRRIDHLGEAAPRAVQLAGSDPAMLADAARYNIDRGAQIIDLNMGCPAKKVCNAAAGSALLRDEALVARILHAVVHACAPHGVPVTLKTRTGWSPVQRNARTVARIAEDAGIALLVLHGRTRCDFYTGHAEYDTIAEVVRDVRIPVIANGDIDTPERAAHVLAHTGAAGVMIGRAGQGRPWIFREIAHFLETGQHRAAPSIGEAREALLDHLREHLAFYGEFIGVRTVRKHLGWYVRGLPRDTEFRDRFNRIESPDAQADAVAAYFDGLGPHAAPLPYHDTFVTEKLAA